MKVLTPNDAWENAAKLLRTYFEEENPKGYQLLVRIHEDNKEQMLKMPAAVKYHHACPGGYIVHVNEVMTALDKMLNEDFGGGTVNHGRAMMAAYVHDFDKLERYELLDWEAPTEPQMRTVKQNNIPYEEGDSKKVISTKIGNFFNKTDDPIEHFRYKPNQGHGFDETAKVQQMLVKYGLPLQDDVLHAITMHHGGYAVHAKEYHMKISPMATLLHMADMVSSKVWSKL